MVLIERLDDGDAVRIADAWSSEETFALLPARSAVGAGWAADRLAELPEELHVGHVALLTSGSTGTPKLVVGVKRRVEELARVLDSVQGNEPAGEALCALPLSYSFAFVNQWAWSHVRSLPLRRTPGLRDPAAFARDLAAAESAMLCLVGVQGALLLEAMAGRSFPGITRLHFAGGRFPHEQLAGLRALFPAADITNNYGCAEAFPRLAVRAADVCDDAADVGWPLPSVQLRADRGGAMEFRSPYGAVAIADERGVRTIGAQDWVPTGDLGAPSDSGRWRVLGRAHEVFKRHGEKVMLNAVLGAIHERWPGEAASYRACDRCGEDGWVLVLAPDPDHAEVRGVLRALRERFSRAQWPLRIEAAPRVPRLPNGKIDGAALAAGAGGSVVWNQRV